MKNFIKENWDILLICLLSCLLLFVVLKSCTDKNELTEHQTKLQKTAVQKKVSELQNQFQQKEFVIKKLLDSIEKQKQAANKTEKKLYLLQQQTRKPQYIELAKDCNDTLQNCYNFSIKKDSLCREVIDAKNKIIQADSTALDFEKQQKARLSKIINSKDTLLSFNEKIIAIKNKKLKSETNKKSLWQKIALLLAVFIAVK